MTVTLTPRLEALVRQKVEGGSYRTADEVIEEALRLLDEWDRRHQLRASLIEAEAQIERGEGIPYTPELMDRIKREAEDAVRRGATPDPDVCPWPTLSPASIPGTGGAVR